MMPSCEVSDIPWKPMATIPFSAAVAVRLADGDTAYVRWNHDFGEWRDGETKQSIDLDDAKGWCEYIACEACSDPECPRQVYHLPPECER